jgi:hypothetical protein
VVHITAEHEQDIRRDIDVFLEELSNDVKDKN